MTDETAPVHSTKSFLDRYLGSRVPGLQYVVVTADRVLFEYAGGRADIRGDRAMTPATTLMAYSMTKTITAIAILQLLERGKLRLDDLVDRYLPVAAYRGHGITLRQILTHTSGIPNPLPLRWVHLAAEHAGFDEEKALAAVLRENPDLAFAPGRRYGYSNIGYWLLGKVVERVTAQSYCDYVRANILEPLRLAPAEMDFVIADESRHAAGYLEKYSLLNLVRGFVIDRRFVGEYAGRWLRLNSHYPNGPAFGGLIGSAAAFGRLLQDQLRDESVLLNADTRRLLETRQTDGAGRPVPMTPGWHVGESHGLAFFFKEGGGGGFHCEMRVYSSRGVATVAMANSTGFAAGKFLNRADRAFVDSRL